MRQLRHPRHIIVRLFSLIIALFNAPVGVLPTSLVLGAYALRTFTNATVHILATEAPETAVDNVQSLAVSELTSERTTEVSSFSGPQASVLYSDTNFSPGNFINYLLRLSDSSKSMSSLAVLQKLGIFFII